MENKPASLLVRMGKTTDVKKRFFFSLVFFPLFFVFFVFAVDKNKKGLF